MTEIREAEDVCFKSVNDIAVALLDKQIKGEVTEGVEVTDDLRAVSDCTQSAFSHPTHTTRTKFAAHRFSRAALLTHPAHYFRRRVTAAVALARIGPLQDAMEESDPCVFVIEYCDGFRAFLLGMGSYKVPRNIDDGQICESNPCATRK